MSHYDDVDNDAMKRNAQSQLAIADELIRQTYGRDKVRCSYTTPDKVVNFSANSSSIAGAAIGFVAGAAAGIYLYKKFCG